MNEYTEEELYSMYFQGYEKKAFAELEKLKR